MSFGGALGVVMGGINLAVRAASGETLTAMDYLNQLLIQPAITSLTLTLSVGGAFLIGIAAKAAWIFGEAGKFLTIGQQVVRGLTFAVSTAAASVFGGMLSAAANKQSLYSSKTWQGIGYGAAVGAGLGFLGGGAGTKLMRSLSARPAAAPAAGDAPPAGDGDEPIVGDAVEDIRNPAEYEPPTISMPETEFQFHFRVNPPIEADPAVLGVSVPGYRVAGGHAKYMNLAPSDLPEGQMFFINRNQAYWNQGDGPTLVTFDREENGYSQRYFDAVGGTRFHYFNSHESWPDPTRMLF
jgi:hypothetical protein